MKQFVPVCDEDLNLALSAGLVPVPYRTGVYCFHALREQDDADTGRKGAGPDVVATPAGLFD